MQSGLGPNHSIAQTIFGGGNDGCLVCVSQCILDNKMAVDLTGDVNGAS